MRYENMPSRAQNLPDEKSLAHDRGIVLDVYQCSGCGLVQLDPAIDPVPYFQEVIRAAAVSAEMKDFRTKQFRDFVREYSLKKKKVIEIGCGRGEYLALMREAGADTYGLEYSAESVEQCRKLGLAVTQGFLENSDYRLPNAPFDAFFILNFLEHLPEPNQVLRGIYNNLQNNSVGLVEVPNLDMILRNKLFSEFMRDHLFYFTKESLCITLELNGFEVISIAEVWHDYSLSAVIKKRVPLDLSAFSAARAKIQKELDEFIGRHNKVAIWGAGHQAFALMSMMNLGDKIKYVVDSAPFKQGKFTPATHLPILAPETLRRDPVDAVIIMAGSYSDEVKKNLRENFDKNITVAVLRDFGLEF